MAAKKKYTAKEAATKVLQDADGGPLTVKEICERSMRLPLSLKGKTPAATITAMLHVAAKKGELFRKTDKGTFELLAASGDTPSDEAQPDEKQQSEDDSPAVTPNSKVIHRGNATEAKPDPKPSRRRSKKEAEQVSA